MAEYEDIEEGAYISVIEAKKLIPRPFEGNPKQLRESFMGQKQLLELLIQINT